MNIKKKTLILIIMLSMGIIVSGCVSSETNSPTNNPSTSINNQQITKPSSNAKPPNVPVNNVPVNNLNQINNVQINLEDYSNSNGIFSMKKPAGWSVVTAGQCANLGVLVRDDNAPENQVFSIIKLEPFFLSDAGRQWWSNYVFPGGSRLPGVEMPVVSPFTPENFLLHFGQAAQTNYLKNYQMPVFEKVYIVSAEPLPGANAQTMRAVFVQNGKVTEGLFFVSLVAGTSELGTAYLFTGITADKNNFKYVEKSLVESLGSISINPQYVSSCMEQSKAISNDASQASKTLSGPSDTIMSSWNEKNKADDIISDKRGDEMAGIDRLKDPDTNNVYAVDPNFYQSYDLHRQSFDMSNLQKPSDDDWGAYESTPLNQNNIH